jgi:hypothetical protein
MIDEFQHPGGRAAAAPIRPGGGSDVATVIERV